MAGAIDISHFDREFAVTNKLRTLGTDHLLAAARKAGVKRRCGHRPGRKSFER